MLFACRIAFAGTPCRRAIESSVSPCATMIAVPPSQLQFCAAGAGWRGYDDVLTEPVTSWRAGACEPPTPALPPYDGSGSAECSTLCDGAGCTEPVISFEA